MSNVNWPQYVYTTGWVVWALLFVVLETVAILDRDAGDTLTEHVRPLIVSTSFAWFAAAGFLSWLPYHFLIEGR